MEWGKRTVGAIVDEPKLRPLREAVDHCIAHYSGRTVLHVPNPGNAGNSLLALGTYQAFERHAVKFEVIDLDASVDGKVVFLGGGGNFVPIYGDTRFAFERFLGRAKKIILLPHTIRGNEDLLTRLDSSCTLFCRDTVSCDHVRSTNPKLNALLAHDMAFHVDVQGLLDSTTLIRGWQDILEEKLTEAGLSEKTIRSWPSVDFLRLGVESIWESPETDADISVLFRFESLAGSRPFGGMVLSEDDRLCGPHQYRPPTRGHRSRSNWYTLHVT